MIKLSFKRPLRILRIVANSIQLIFLLSFCVTIQFATTQNIHAAQLYKWVDKNGNVSYQDSPPPDSANVTEQSTIETNTYNNTNRQNNTAANASIIVYTTNSCQACNELLDKLKKWSVPAEEQSILNRDIQSKILSLSDQITAPTLFINDKLITDLSDSSLLSELTRVGFQIDSSEKSEDQKTPNSAPSEPLNTEG